MSNPDKTVFMAACFSQIESKIAKLATLHSRSIDDISFGDEALILCLIYIDGLATLFYGGWKGENFCRALSELSGNPTFAKLHRKKLFGPDLDKYWNTAAQAKLAVEMLVSAKPDELFDSAEIADAIRSSGVPRDRQDKLILNLWRSSIGAICYAHMRTGAVHNLGTNPLSFDETIYNGKKGGLVLDFDVLYAALQSIRNTVAGRLIEPGEG